MKKAVTLFYKALDKLCFVVIAIGFATIVAVLGMQICLRFIEKPTMWAEELCRYCFIWLLFIGMGVAFSKGGHLTVDFLFIKFNRKVQLVLLFVYYIVILLFTGYFFYSGILYCQTQWERPTFTMLWLNFGTVYLCVPVGCVITFFYIIRELYFMIVKKERYLEEKGGALG